MKRQDVIDLLNNSSTAKYVVQKLNEFYPLPTDLGDYIIAGGSVAAILNGMVNNVPCKINDLDVYTWKLYPEKKPDETLTTLRLNRHGEYAVIDSLFEINRVDQPNPKLDIIDIKKAQNCTSYAQDLDIRNIIHTFDLNCTQVCISVKTNNIHFAPQFVDFLTTRQIELNRISLGSVLRAVRKVEELSAYFDIYKAAVLISERQRLPPDIHEHIEVCSAMCYEKHRGFVDRLLPHIEVKTWDGKSYFPEVSIQDHPIKFAFDKLQNISYFVPSIGIINLYNLLYNGKSQHYRDLFKMFCNTELAHYLFLGSDYIGVNPEISKIGALSEYLKKHNLLDYGFSKYNYNQQLQLMTNINCLENKYGKTIVGVLEMNPHLFTPKGLDMDKAVKLLKKKIHEQEALLFKSKLPVINSKSTIIEELACLKDLEKEGSELHHCVGGYSPVLKRGTSRIFSLRDKETNDRSTLQLDMVKNEGGKLVFSIRQHRSRQNKTPTELQTRVANKLVEILNRKELLYAEYN